MLLYFIKSAIAMTLFYGVYRMFMEQETNYSLNRFYLVGTIFLSLVLPILPLEKLFIFESYRMPVFFIIDEQGVTSSGFEVNNSSGVALSINGFFLARIVYLSGIGILFGTLIVQIIRLLFIKRVGKDLYGPLKVISVTKNILPFSILNRVFISQETRKDPKLNTILDHEYAHFRFLHFLDLLLLEFITIFQWFNPLAWLYVKSLKEIHEYQADAAVLRSGEATGSYQALLVNQLTGTEVFRLANGFSKSLTKKRMIMMTKVKSRKSAWLKALLAMPVLAILLIAYAANAPYRGDYVVKGKVVRADTGAPLPGTSVIWKATTIGTVTDMNGRFELHVEDNDAVVVYSFVGFETTTTKGAGKFLVKMDKEIIEISDVRTEIMNTPSPETQASDPEPVEDTITNAEEVVFIIVEDMPKFRGQIADSCRPWIKENLVYPMEAKELDLQGKVYVQFVVGTKGEVKDVTVRRGLNPILDKAAVKTIASMPAWTPGKQRGIPVATQFVMAVEFNQEE